MSCLECLAYLFGLKLLYPHKITLLRGNISMVEDYLANEGQGQSYRVVAESHAVLPLILVRNL